MYAVYVRIATVTGFIKEILSQVGITLFKHVDKLECLLLVCSQPNARRVTHTHTHNEAINTLFFMLGS